MLAAGVPGVHSASLVGSIWRVTLIPRAGPDSLRVKSTGTLTHGCAGETHSPAGLAATVEPGGVANTPVAYAALPVQPLASVAVTVNTEVPGVVGVPEITPEAAPRVSPAGRVPLVTA